MGLWPSYSLRESLLASRWLGACLTQGVGRSWRPAPTDEIHLILAVAGHFEPRQGGVSAGQARARVEHWAREYPRALGGFHDADGRPPQHTFFYPVEEYDPVLLDMLADLCRQGYGEVEVQLHHHDDTADGLRETLGVAVRVLSERHGLLARRRGTGELAFGFVHGNWALNNSRPDGGWCGVNDEIRVLHETGCYADFTFPSAPDPTQPPTINRIYYAKGDPGRPFGHAYGVEVGRGPVPAGSLMMIPGPLLLHWRDRKWEILPRLENGCLQANQPATAGRVDLWLRARVQVPARPDWYFVKLHCHGAPESQWEALLGDPRVAFHRALDRRAAEDSRFHVHYVTTREMYNLVRAAEAGWGGAVSGALDFEIVRGGAAV